MTQAEEKSQFIEVPEGKLAAIVTYFQMHERPAPRAIAQLDAELVEHKAPSLEWYRDLFIRVGGMSYLWQGRLRLSDEELMADLSNPTTRVYSLRVDGKDEGLLELDFSTSGECYLGYFGLTQAMVGQGAGRWLMEQALGLAWAQPIQRFWLHTCTLDSPQAVPFYQRSGFTAYRRRVEIFDDPRINGLLPKEAAPQIPLL